MIYTCTYIHVHTYLNSTYIIHTYVHTNIHAHIHTYIWAYIHTCTFIQNIHNAYIHRYMHTVYIQVLYYTYNIHTCTYTHTCKYVHTHTQCHPTNIVMWTADYTDLPSPCMDKRSTCHCAMPDGKLASMQGEGRFTLHVYIVYKVTQYMLIYVYYYI